ncbi:hypothetical protein SCHPADRAFT_921493 [Schizopora paradoxa]|uniref:PIN domain-containing protein n=1 Tax=Schizopora paradoxa TaxID=27342 RepID=A0A0H2RRH9_9AGAM|nr:hypothetical protein SCHPADRAFT_921493 [Schizopora paradoxa]
MTDGKDPSKVALSRALGAAFLSHKVEELEKTVSTTPNYGGFQGREKKDRRLSPTLDFGTRGRGGRGRGGRPQRGGRPRAPDDEYKGEHSYKPDNREEERIIPKDADVVVVDASVLIHALGQMKVWAKYGRQEIIIVPLEVLNTLDLLKKGSSALAQRARAASRILEQQVGTNPRIRVQQDDAFVFWDDISFALEEITKDSDETQADLPASQATPEWLRRTVSCARWELDISAEGKGSADSDKKPTSVVIAVCTSPLESSTTNDAPNARSPVPLPAPQPPSKFEQRCSGTLVAQWAKAAGVGVLDVKATAPPSHGGPSGGRRGGASHARTSSDEEWRGGHSTGRKTYAQASRGGRDAPRDLSAGKVVEEKPVYGPGRVGGTLIERPAATVAMNATLMEPAKVIRVLARGEKLEP